MRKVILSTNITLDGFMSGPHGELDWHFANWNDEMEEYVSEQKKTIDTILIGRVTYNGMANYWPAVIANPDSRKHDIEFAEWMNSLPKVVFSKTLKKAEWNNSRLVKENISEEILYLKKKPGKDMIIWGGAGIVSTFIQLGLIDEYRIWIAPVLIGKGIPIGKDLSSRIDLKLFETIIFSNGVVLNQYRPK